MDKNFLTLAALVAAPAITLAQAAPPPDGRVADPATPVAAPLYQSAFGASGQGLVTDLQPWAEANATVGQFQRGHMDIVRWERAQEAAARTGDMPADGPRQQEGAR